MHWSQYITMCRARLIHPQKSTPFLYWQRILIVPWVMSWSKHGIISSHNHWGFLIMRIFTPLHRGMTISVHEKNTQAMTWSQMITAHTDWLDPSRCSRPSHSMAEMAQVGHHGISLTFPAQSRGRAKTAVGLSCRLWWQWGRDMSWWHLSRLRAVQKPSIKSLPILRAYRIL